MVIRRRTLPAILTLVLTAGGGLFYLVSRERCSLTGSAVRE